MTREASSGSDISTPSVGRQSSTERLVVVTVTLSVMLAPLNSTMIAVAMPDIMQHFDVGIASAGWLVTSYLVAMASLQPVAGKIGDCFGRRRLVLGGLALFGVASLAAAVAPSLWLLLLFRVLQAVAGALSGSSSLQTGTILAALSASMIILAPLGGRLADRLGRRLPSTAGLAVMTAGALLIALEGSDISLVMLVVGLTLVGSGLAVATPGLQTTAVEAVDPQQAGAAAGVYSTSRYLGSILGSAIIAGLLHTDDGDASGMGLVFVVVVVAAVLATAASLGLRARPEASRRDLA